MQRKQLNADKDGKENRETELGDCKKTKKTQTEIKASKLKRKRFERVVKKKEKNLKYSLSNQEIRRGPLEDVKEGNKKQINVCKDSEGASEAYLSIMACQSYEDLEIVADQLQLSPISEKTPDVTITTHKRTVDKASMSLVPNDDGLENLFPCLIYGDGNCPPRCGSLFAYGTENKHLDIRARIVLHLVKYKEIYLNADFIRNDRQKFHK